MSTALSIAVLFYRIGPYHFARLRAAATALRVTAIEYASRDTVYDWDEVRGAEGFERVTLFPGGSLESRTASEIAAGTGRVLEQVNPQVVAIPGWADRASLSALRWCVRRGVPAVVMSETTAWDEARRQHKEWVKRQIVSAFSAGLVGGQPHRDYLASLGIPPERVFLGYDVVDGRYFEDRVAEIRSAKSEVRSKCGLPERYFLASARFVEKKNLARLLQAYARYREKAEMLKGESTPPQPSPQSGEGVAPISVLRPPSSAPWSLVLLGDGPLRDALNSQLSTLNLEGHVLLPGFKQYPELPSYYGLASAFIHASTTEPWGLVVNEAMASGLPVLVSNRCGCAQDLVQDGVNGFTFDPYNVQELAQLMFKVSAFQPFSLSAFGLASQRIIGEWGPERFASGLRQAVETVLRVPRPEATLFGRFLLRALALR